MKNFFGKEFTKEEQVEILLIMMLLSGVFGFIYEEIFYWIDLGYIVKRGSTFGPIIPIYFFGGGLIVLGSYRLRKNPFLVFLINNIITGILEYGTGYVLDHFFHLRLWDYNNEILNYGNINGYICLRSILFFGVASLFLIYIVLPIVLKGKRRFSKEKVKWITWICTMTFILDMIIHFLLTRK